MNDRQQPRRILWVSLALLIAIFIVLEIMPITYFWIFLLDVLHLHFWWPLLLPVGSFILWRQATGQFQQTGEPQFFPSLSRGLFVVCLLLLFYWFGVTAVQWSLWWLILLLIPFSLGVWKLVVILFAYSELWRQYANRAVNREVSKGLMDGRFKKQLNSDPEQWGSLHQLISIRQHYLNAQEEIKRHFLDDTYDNYLQNYLECADNLLSYTAVRWSESVLPAHILDWWRTELLREIISLYLVKPPIQQGTIDWKRKINGWIGDLSKIEHPYSQMLVYIFRLVQDNHQAVSLESTVQDVLEKFAELPSAFQAPDDTATNVLEICAFTWAALAHHTVPSQVCFDVWMAMRARQEKTIFIENSDDIFPVFTAAQNFLADWYNEWAAQIGENWNQGLQGRATYAQTLAQL